MWGIRALWTILTAAIRIALTRLVRGARRPGWTWRRELMTMGVQALFNRATKLPDAVDQRRLVNALAFPPETLSQVRCEPVDVGGIPAWWITPHNDAGEAIVYYVHGGGYVLEPRQPDDLTSQVAMLSRSKTLTLGYRLAPEHPFPAALEDALAGYRFLLDRGINPTRLAVAGDSAGGGLVLALLLSLRATKERMPALALLLSPWVDLECKGASMTANQPYDTINQELIRRWAKWYAGEADLQDPLISPINARLDGLPPIYMQAGGAEILIDQIRAFELQAKADGARVQLDVWEYMPHAFQAFGLPDPETRQALEKLQAVFRHHILSGPA